MFSVCGNSCSACRFRKVLESVRLRPIEATRPSCRIVPTRRRGNDEYDAGGLYGLLAPAELHPSFIDRLSSRWGVEAHEAL